MHFLRFLLPLVALATAASGAVISDAAKKPQNIKIKRSCRSNPTKAFFNISQAAEKKEKTQAAMGVTDATPPFLIVDTYFHIVSTTKNKTDGYAPADMVTKQFLAMSKAYFPYNIILNFRGADWTVNQTWATGGDEIGMGKKLRKGRYGDLNVYFLSSLPDSILGYCYFPVSPKPMTTDNMFFQDGCKVLTSSMPGGSPGGPYNMGLTAVHEVGHWFGLLHTFQGSSCSGDGDYVADTPVELEPTFGCPANKDTCPAQPGLDPIHNYMDYSDDSCYTSFTPGQKTRMFTMYTQYRA